MILYMQFSFWASNLRCEKRIFAISIAHKGNGNDKDSHITVDMKTIAAMLMFGLHACLTLYNVIIYSYTV